MHGTIERPRSRSRLIAILFLLPGLVKDPIAIFAHLMSMRILRFTQPRVSFPSLGSALPCLVAAR